MSPDELVFGFIQYIVFLFSTTCHEAAHALIAKRGGDMTAFEGGQVSLNPIPHIRREPFGMVILPILGVVSHTGLIGWASAPYDPLWSQRHPRRAAWMSLAGPATNFLLAILAVILMRVGLALHIFQAGFYSSSHVVTAPAGGLMEGVAVVLSILFSLNLLLGCFNLLPFPPLDGFGVLGLFTTEEGARWLQTFRVQIRSFSIIGLLLGWRLLDHFYSPLLHGAIDIAFTFYVSPESR